MAVPRLSAIPISLLLTSLVFVPGASANYDCTPEEEAVTYDDVESTLDTGTNLEPSPTPVKPQSVARTCTKGPNCIISQWLDAVTIMGDTDNGANGYDPNGADSWRFRFGTHAWTSKWTTFYPGETGDTITFSAGQGAMKSRSVPKKSFDENAVEAFAMGFVQEQEDAILNPNEDASATGTGPLLACTSDQINQYQWNFQAMGTVRNSTPIADLLIGGYPPGTFAVQFFITTFVQEAP